MDKTDKEIEKFEQVDKVEKKERKNGFVYDHKGQPFWCINAMCDHWKISPLLYLTRRRLGLSKKASLTMISASRQRFQDHEGNRFKSFTQMCNFWGQEVHVVRARIKLNWTIEQALEMEVEHRKQCRDHEGRLFESYKDMNEIDMLEMICDWYARNRQFDSGNFIDFVSTTQKDRFQLDEETFEKIIEYCRVLDED